MATSNLTYQIFQGSPTTTSTGAALLGIGSAGTRGASRRLVHPDSASLPPVVYAIQPARTINLDNDVLFSPIAVVTRTVGSTRVTRFARRVEDVIVTEIWSGDDARAAMTTAQFRQLYEYLVNPPAFDPTSQTYVTWEPRDRTTKIYQVELVSLSVGRGGENEEFDVADLRSRGGFEDGGLFAAGFDGLEVLPTGVIDREVRLSMRVVAEVSP